MSQGASSPLLRAGAGALSAALVGYCWWATGTTPFTAVGYLAVAIPILAVLALAAVDLVHSHGGTAPDASETDPEPVRLWPGALPWLVLLAAAVVLEAAGLAAGGRSRQLPTLSDVMDHLLVWQASRTALFLVWVVVGALLAAPALTATARRRLSAPARRSS